MNNYKFQETIVFKTMENKNAQNLLKFSLEVKLNETISKTIPRINNYKFEETIVFKIMENKQCSKFACKMYVRMITNDNITITMITK